MAGAVLTLAELNRATLARQLLLRRERMAAIDAIERLAGLQAQLARPPYVALWSRVHGFAREELTRALHAREVVRATLMRATLHLFSARDYRVLRATLQPMLDKGMRRSTQGGKLDGLEVPALASEAERFFGKPRTFDELRDHLVSKHPDADERAMGYAVRCTLPLVQVPDEESAWGFHGRADFVAARAWIGAPVDGPPDTAALVRRYLAGFGPATASDAQAWSGLGSLKAAFEALRKELVTFRDERGRELFDLPGAPRPPGGTPAPVRFLPEFDNLVLGHEDRRRVIDDAHRSRVATPNLQVLATFLVDGRVAGTWKAERKKATASLSVLPFGRLTKKLKDEISAEGSALLSFTDPDAAKREVRFAP